MHVIYERSAFRTALVFDSVGNLLGALPRPEVDTLPRLNDASLPDWDGIRWHVIDPGRKRVFAKPWERRAIARFSRYFSRSFHGRSPLMDSHGPFARFVEPHLRSPPATLVLDIGAGGAGYSALLDQRIISFDLPGVIDKGATGTHVAGTAEALPFVSGAFHLVMCLFVLEHAADPFALLREACRVLAAGGRLVLAFPSASLGDVVRAIVRRPLTLPIHHLRTFGIVGGGVIEPIGQVLRCLREQGCGSWTVEGVFPNRRVRSRFPANRLGGQTVIVAEKEAR